MRTGKAGRVLLGVLVVLGIARVSQSQPLPDAQWRSANGPRGASVALLSALAVDPTDSSRAYGCGADGLFKTTTGGAEWWRVGPVGIYCSAIAMDPLHPGVLYVQNRMGDSSGLLKTTDGGETWTRGMDGYGSQLAIAPDSSALYAAEGPRINSSTDGGASWSGWVYLPSPGESSPSRNVAALLVDPAAPARVYAGTPGGVYRSLDGGASWLLPSNSGLTSADVRALLASGSNLYAGTTAGLFVSANGGVSWTLAGADTAGKLVLSLAARFEAPAAMYAAVREGTTYQILRSSDGGASWSPLTSPLASVSAVYVEPGGDHALYALGKAGGVSTVLRSTDDGTSWEARTTGLEVSEVTSMAFDPHQPGRLFTGEKGRISSIDWPSGTWQTRATGLGSIWQIAFAPSAPDQVYAADFCRGVWGSQDGGGTWRLLVNGLSVTCVEGIVVDPATPTTVYASTNDGVFKSTNSGELWSPINNGTLPTSGTRRDFQAIAIDPTTPTTLYLGGTVPDHPAFTTRDGGASWVPSQPLPPNPVGYWYVWSVVVDPANGSTIYLAADGVYKSTDGGATWSPAGLSGRSVRALLPDPLDPNVLYAGLQNDNRVYRSGDGGASWQPVGQGLPQVGVLSLAFDPTGTTLFAGTSGLGVYYLPVPRLQGTISVATNLAEATFTITGPATYTGSGTSFLQANAPAGEYTISYGAVAGYTTPASEAKTLAAGGGIGFTGTYTPTPPALTCPPSITLKGCNVGAIGPLAFSASEVSISLAQLVAAGGRASATCGIQSITYQDRLAGSCPNLVATRTFRVVDGCGQATSGIQTFRFAQAQEPEADLAVVDVSYTAYPIAPHARGAVFWEFFGVAKIANLGKVTVAHPVVRFNFPHQAYLTLDALAPGAAVWVELPRDVTGRGATVRPGTYTFTVSVDPLDRIPETSESNNVKTVSVVLQPESVGW